ncbi:MAG: RNA polymerase subunit sigma-24 [Candidatus Accumulibacter sp.]|nr:RNA polymerase subunit sigma-24 [Accumulibacter sp.]
MAASAEEPHKAGRAESAASAERTACAEEEDRALVARTLAGDAPAFTTLVRRYQERVFRFVLRLCGTRDEALDLTQETFMKAHQALPGWRPEAQFRTWLFSIAHNATLDVLRRRQRVIFVPLAADSPDDAVAQRPDPGARPDERCADRQRIALLDRALRELPAEQREILWLRELEDMSYGEIAAALGIAEGTVKSRLARARAAALAGYRRHTGED